MVGAGTRFESLLRADTGVSNADARSLRDSGKELQTLGWIFSGVAVAGIGTAVVMFLLGAPAPSTTVSFAATPSGGAVTLSGSFDFVGGGR
jgi:hypothetical protein